jgi:hypothetical protein
MTRQEAWQIIDSIVAQVKLDRKDTAVVTEAMNELKPKE